MPPIATRDHCEGSPTPGDRPRHTHGAPRYRRREREALERAKARPALVSIACLIATACAGTTTTEDAPGPSASARPAPAESAPTAASSTRADGAPSSRASASASSAPLSEEERERQNEGCKYRKSTGKLSRCEAVGKRSALSAKDLGEAVKLSRNACYCVDDLPALVNQCMAQVGSGSVKLTVGTLDDPTDCALTVTSLEAAGRRFARFHADVRDVATFYATLSILEVRSDKTERLFDGFNELDPAEVKGWSKLPAAVQRFMKGE